MTPAPTAAAKAHAAALALAEAECAKVGETLTPLRRQVLELLWASRGPAKAYDLLDALKTDRQGAKPPTIYRALEFLVRVGLAHRVESLNAFMACDVGHNHGAAIVFICSNCQGAEEAHAEDALHEVERAAAKSRFQVRRAVIEAVGLCRACQAQT
jgi:Fur family transcriptional regulator, zinc uptake regulator